MSSAISDFLDSIFNTTSYNRLRQKRIRSGLGYFLFWQFLFSLVTTTYVIAMYLPSLQQSLQLLSQTLQQEPLSSTILTIEGNQVKIEPATEIKIPNPNTNKLLNAPILISLSSQASSSGSLSAIHIDPDSFNLRLEPLGSPLELPWNAIAPNGATITAQSAITEVNRLIQAVDGFPYTLAAAVVVGLWLNFCVVSLILIGIHLLLYSVLSFLMPIRLKLSHFFSLCLHTIVIAQLLNVFVTVVYSKTPEGFMSWAFIIITTIALFAIRKDSLPKKMSTNNG